VVDGTVRETAPTEARVISGATITAQSGGTTATGTSDANGRFRLVVPAGEIRVAVVASRYDNDDHVSC